MASSVDSNQSNPCVSLRSFWVYITQVHPISKDGLIFSPKYIKNAFYRQFRVLLDL